jgi:hypothetical protein
LIRNCVIPVALHFLPNDAESATAATGISYRSALAKAGLAEMHALKVVPRCVNIWDGINYLRDILLRSWFRLPATLNGIEALEAYHTKEVTTGSAIAKEPVHDWSSHDADAARTAAEALVSGMAKINGQRIVRDLLESDGKGVVHYGSLRDRERQRGSALSGMRL